METIQFKYSVTYQDENGAEQSEEHSLNVPKEEVKDVFQQAMRGTLDGVDKDTIFTELSHRAE